MPTCCRIFLCCEPPQAAEELAEYEGISVEDAAKIHAGYQLVPRSIEPGLETVSDEHVRSAKQRLEKLHRRIQTELRGILLDMGHGTEA